MSGVVFGEYVVGSSPLHKLRPGVKLAGLFVFACATLLFTGLTSALVMLAVGLACALLAGMRSREFKRMARGFWLIAVVLFAFHLWQNTWQRGVEVVAVLLALVLAASALTASTSVADMLDTFAFVLRPLAVVRVPVERASFAMTLVITMIPRLLAVAQETRDAARARGLQRDPRAVLAPFVVRTVADAQLTGEAMLARGLGEERI